MEVTTATCAYDTTSFDLTVTAPSPLSSAPWSFLSAGVTGGRTIQFYTIDKSLDATTVIVTITATPVTNSLLLSQNPGFAAITQTLTYNIGCASTAILTSNFPADFVTAVKYIVTQTKIDKTMLFENSPTFCTEPFTVYYNLESCTDNTYATCSSFNYPSPFFTVSGNDLSIHTEDNANVGFYKMTVYA